MGLSTPTSKNMVGEIMKLKIFGWEIRFCVCGAKMVAITSGFYCPKCHRVEQL